MPPFRLDFTAPERVSADGVRGTPSGFCLTPPDAGWIRCHIERADFRPPRMRLLPLADLWRWSVAVAMGLLPATARTDEEGREVLWVAEALPENRLRLSLSRRGDTRSSFDPARLSGAIAWTEDRGAFLARRPRGNAGRGCRARSFPRSRAPADDARNHGRMGCLAGKP